MARKAIYKHATQVDTNVYPDDGTSPVGSDEWNEAPDAEGMLGFSPQTATITISSGALAVTDSVCVAAAETGTTDTIDTISITDTSEYDLLYLFADTGDTITLTNTSSPSVSGQIKTVSDTNETLSSTTPTILIRKGNYWYGYGGGVVNALNDIGDVTITSASEHQTLLYNGSNWYNNSPDKLIYVCKNATASTIGAGKIVYVSGFHTTSSTIEISLADNSSASTMPAFGFTMESIAAGATGKILQQGQLEDLNTDGIAEGTVLYVGTSGNWSTTKPTGTALIQNIGRVLRDNISAGIIHVGGSGRSNDVPNIANGNVWRGNSSGVATEVNFDTEVSNNTDVASNTSLLGATAGTATASKALIVDSNKDLTGVRNLTVAGDLTVNGTTTTINSTTLTVDDKNIEMGSVATPSDTTADGGGITLKGTTDKSIVWDSANTNWTLNQHINIPTGKEYKINNVKVLDSSSLGTGITSSSLTSIGTIATGTWEATDIGIAHGGTGQSTAQDAINSLTQVSGATDEHVLTKDTTTGNAIWKAAGGGGAHTTQDWTVQSSAPSDPSAGTAVMYVKTIDSNNEGVFIKMKKNGSVVEVQIA